MNVSLERQLWTRRAELDNDEAYLCHCRMCQRATGSVSIAFINARLAAASYLGSPVSTGLYSNPVHSANILAMMLTHAAATAGGLRPRVQSAVRRRLEERGVDDPGEGERRVVEHPAAAADLQPGAGDVARDQADAALAMQLGAEAVFVGSGIFKSEDPARRARATRAPTPRSSGGIGARKRSHLSGNIQDAPSW